MKTYTSVAEYRHWRQSLPARARIGFAPTMGALHAGHAELMRRSRTSGHETVVSIYVNPTQFNNPEDLKKYPRTLEADLEVCREAGVAAVFLPTYEEMYADGYAYKVQESKESLILEGAHRPGHFDGVTSVVMKLFNIVQPHTAFFGEKDYQQLRVVQGMVKAFFMELVVQPVPTLRESDGLAMSSRNVRLTPAERELAPRIHQVLTNAPSLKAARAELSAAGFKVEYVEEEWGRRLAAVQLGGVRLIDNVETPR